MIADFNNGIWELLEQHVPPEDLTEAIAVMLNISISFLTGPRFNKTPNQVIDAVKQLVELIDGAKDVE